MSRLDLTAWQRRRLRRQLKETLDVRVEASLLTVGDGVMLARKRPFGSGTVS